MKSTLNPLRLALLLTLLSIFTFQCKKEISSQNISPSLDAALEAEEEEERILSRITASEHLKYYEHFCEADLGKLSLSQASIRYIEDRPVFFIPSVDKLRNKDGTITTFTRTEMVFYENDNNDLVGVVYDYSSLLVQKGQLTGGYLSLKLMNGLEVYKIYKGVGDEPDYFVNGNDIDIIPTARPNGQTWWGCTTSCYKTAKDACDADAQCKFLCDHLPNCNTNIAIACGVHCVRLGLTPPLTSVAELGEDNPYGFY